VAWRLVGDAAAVRVTVSVRAAAPRKPTARSNASAKRSSTSTCTSARSPTRRSSRRRSRRSSWPSTRCGRTRRWGSGHRSLRTVKIHTYFGG